VKCFRILFFMGNRFYKRVPNLSSVLTRGVCRKSCVIKSDVNTIHYYIQNIVRGKGLVILTKYCDCGCKSHTHIKNQTAENWCIFAWKGGQMPAANWRFCKSGGVNSNQMSTKNERYWF